MSAINGLGSGSAGGWSQVSSQRQARNADASEFKQALFDKTDSDGSGGIDATELQSLLTDISSKTGQSVGGSDAQQTFNTMDGNGDGSLSQDELSSGLKDLMPAPPDTVSFAQSRAATKDEALFKALDGNSDGGVTQDELTSALASTQKSDGSAPTSDDINTLMQKLDGNGDGSVTQDELGSAMQADRASRAADSGGTQAAGGPPPGGAGGPGGPPPAGASGGTSATGSTDSTSSSSSSSSTDPLDTNSDGVVSAQERAVGELKQALQKMLSAADSDSSRQVGGKKLDFGALADQVMRHYAQASNDAVTATTGSSLSVAA